MKKLIIGLVAAALLPMSASVMAKDICISSGSGVDTIKFIGFKTLKKPGATAPIKGVWQENGAYWPFEGIAMMQADATITVGFTMYGMTHPVSGRGFFVEASGLGKDLTGSYELDNTGNFVSDTSLTFVAMDCKDFVVQPPSI